MITRRTTLKAIAAAIMAPTIHLRSAIPDERLLLSFCDPDSWRYDFSKPFGVGSLTYASDYRAMIRCELASRVEDGERRLPKTVTDVWNYHWNPSGEWKPLTPDDLQSTKMERVTGHCPYCGDRRVPYIGSPPKDHEDADALLDWDPDDNTIRDSSCDHCHGHEYTGPSCVRIGEVLHQAWTLRRILALPNPRVCSAAVLSGREKDGYRAILFQADGFQGISLGLSEYSE